MKIQTQTLLVALIAIIFTSCAGGGNSDSSTTKKAKQEIKVDLKNGKAVYDKVCMACHMTGVAGAAKITDKARWEEVAPRGLKDLQQTVINGVPDGKYGVMPARGSCTDCSDKDLLDAVGYILNEAGVLDQAKK